MLIFFIAGKFIYLSNKQQTMESIIVNNFYSKLERLGLKRHKSTDKETDFLNNFNEVQQCDALLDEMNYNIIQITKNLFLTRNTIIFTAFLILLTLLDFSFLRTSIFVGILFLFLLLYLKFKRNIISLLREVNATKFMRETFVKDIFK